MIETDRFIAPTPQLGEEKQDRAIRPRMLDDYIGQPHVREQMEIFIGAAKGRGEALDHTLVFGPPGLGKTTLANIIAEEMGVQIKSTSGPVLERAGDLSGVLFFLCSKLGLLSFIRKFQCWCRLAVIVL